MRVVYYTFVIIVTLIIVVIMSCLLVELHLCVIVFCFLFLSFCTASFAMELFITCEEAAFTQSLRMSKDSWVHSYNEEFVGFEDNERYFDVNFNYWLNTYRTLQPFCSFSNKDLIIWSPEHPYK